MGADYDKVDGDGPQAGLRIEGWAGLRSSSARMLVRHALANS